MSDAARVVVVDDEPVILDLLLAVLRDGPWRVEGAANGREALARIEAGQLDVLLTDKNLPDLGGLELVAAARARDRHTQCLVITGYPSLDTALEAMQLEVFDYIVKPPRDIFEVRRKVEQALTRGRMARENERLLADLTQKNAALQRALADLTALQAEVIQSEKLAGIGTLAAGVAHEVSSPLFGILGLAEAIAEEDDLGRARGHASEIVRLSRQIKEIVQSLTRYSRPAEDASVEPVDVAAAIRDAARLVARSSGFPEDRLALDLEEGLWVRARGSEIQQVFVNLVKNACEAATARHGPRGGAVRVVLRRDGEQVRAEVHDDGVGVSEAHRPLLFDPFFTTKPPGQGTGLGLNIVYRIATRYRGVVAVDSPEGGGAVFTVRLPAVAPGGGA